MNATKFEKVLVTGICILAAVLVILITVNMLRVQDAAAATVGAHSHAVYSPSTTVYTVEVIRPQIAAFSARPDACRTWNIGGVDATDGITCWNMSPAPMVTVDNVPQNALESSYVPNTPTVDDGDKPTEEPTVTDKPELPADDKPVKVDDGSKPAKKHCDNGNGNGAEGCNASDKGNQDETGDKGDKADGRDNGNSDNGHGKGQDKK